MRPALEFLKKNYEKVLLGVVLMGLVVAAAFLPVRIANEKKALTDLREKKFDYPVRPLEQLKTNRYELALQEVTTPLQLDFSSTNKLFNPVRWLRGSDNKPIKNPVGQELKQLEITGIKALYLTISLDTVNVSEIGGPRYVISVEQEAAARSYQRSKRPYYTSLGERKDVFTLRQVQGPPDKPTALILELNDSGDRISISPDRPFRRVDGYMADLRYPPERKTFPERRVGDRISVGGEEYNIVAITENEVVLSARSNGKKYTIRYNAAP